jgi:hypothetical protein
MVYPDRIFASWGCHNSFASWGCHNSDVNCNLTTQTNLDIVMEVYPPLSGLFYTMLVTLLPLLQSFI